jgi:hypothetical protein
LCDTVVTAATPASALSATTRPAPLTPARLNAFPAGGGAGPGERRERAGHLVLGDAAHLRDGVDQLVEVGVVGVEDVLAGHEQPQPKRPVM